MQDEVLLFLWQAADFLKSSLKRRNGSGLFLLWQRFVVGADKVRGGHIQCFGAGLHDFQGRIDGPAFVVVDHLHVGIDGVGKFCLRPAFGPSYWDRGMFYWKKVILNEGG